MIWAARLTGPTNGEAQLHPAAPIERFRQMFKSKIVDGCDHERSPAVRAVYCTWSTSTGCRRNSRASVKGIHTNGVCGKVCLTLKLGQRLAKRSMASRLVT